MALSSSSGRSDAPQDAVSTKSNELSNKAFVNSSILLRTSTPDFAIDEAANSPDLTHTTFDCNEYVNEVATVQNDDQIPRIVDIPQYIGLPSEDTEDIYSYHPGGFHPVHLGDIIAGRFEVIHKLGFGGFATIWLCYEIKDKEWRAVKINRADESYEERAELQLLKYLEKQGGFDRSEWEANHITLPLEHFWIDGPNGRHLCEVLPVLGPSIDYKWRTQDTEEGISRLNDLFFQAATALRFLHKQEICHGDLTPHNMLIRLKDISHIMKEDMKNILGDPKLESVSTVSRVHPGPMVPKYKVVPVDMKCLGITNDLVITDFGESFRASKSPSFSGIPCKYGAPEAVFGCDPGMPADIWSLACSILKVRANAELFSYNHPSYALCIEVMLGPLPEPYRSAYYGRLKEDLEDAGRDWRDYTAEKQSKLGENDLNWLMWGPTEVSFEWGLYFPDGQSEGSDEPLRPVTRPEAYDRLIKFVEYKAEKFGYTNRIDIEIGMDRKYHLPLLNHNEMDLDYGEWKETILKVPDEEVKVLGDLLRRIIKYDPEERIDIEEVLKHECLQHIRKKQNL
ncbi:kinase-like domain-containing protein [Whalleya microplaca]|nr:kinase-like domain-containing protein [Whalleya microplaca]